MDETIDFKITFSSPLQSSASVKWTTNDGSAKSGEDFRGGTGTLTFNAGESEAVLALPLIDDAVDEGREIFTVRLSDEQGVSFLRPQERTATGTITNDDPMPRAWLSRFGRTVGSQAVEVISSRMGAPSDSNENRVVIGGVEVGSGSGSDEDGEEDDDLQERSRGERFRQGAFGWKDAPRSETERVITLEELLLGSSFSLRGQSEPGGNAWAVWGQALTSSFEGTEEDVTLQGEVKSGFLGMDLSSGNWKAGLALSQSQGKGTFDLLDEGSVEDSGKVESSLTGFYPYLGYEWGENKALWALLGFGEGDMKITQLADEERLEDKVTETDISMKMGALGAKTPLMSQDEGDRLDVVIQTDGMYVRMNSGASEGMEAAETDVSRLRLMIDASSTFEIGRSVVTPSFQMGVRRDAGDAEEGIGLEAGGKLSFVVGGLTLEGSVRKLLTHEESGYEEWGASAALRLDPGESGRGLNLSITPTWGEPSSNIDSLWSAEGAHQFGSGDFEAGSRLDAEIGYGFVNPFKELYGVLTPYFGLSLKDNSRVHRTGTRWYISPNANLGLELSHTKGSHKESDDKAITLHAGFSW